MCLAIDGVKQKIKYSQTNASIVINVYKLSLVILVITEYYEMGKGIEGTLPKPLRAQEIETTANHPPPPPPLKTLKFFRYINTYINCQKYILF